MTDTPVHGLLRALAQLLRSLSEASPDLEALRAVVEEAGWEPELMPGVDALVDPSIWEPVSAVVEALTDGASTDTPSLARFMALLDLARDAPAALEEI
jgi:hypothetical protein